MNALKHGSKQSNNLILDITDTPISESEIIKTAKSRLRRVEVRLSKVWIIKDGKTVGIYES